MNILLPILAAAGYAVYKWGGQVVDAANALSYEPRGIRLNGKKIVVKIAIINAAPVALFFDKIHLDAFYNTTAIGMVNKEERVNIPAAGEAIVEIPFEIKKINLVQAIFAAIQARQLGTVTVKGFIQAGPIKVPVEFTKKLEA